MIFKNVKLLLLRVDLKEGVGKKSGKSYKFYVANVLDEDARVLPLNLSDDVITKRGEEGMAKLMAVRNEAIRVDLDISPKGFDLGGTILAIV